MEIGRTWTIWRQTPGSESQFHGHVHQGNDLPSSFSCRFGGGNVSMSRMCWRCILEADVAISGQIPTPSMLGPRFYVFCRTTYAYIQSLRLLHDRDKMLASPFDGVFSLVGR